VLICIEYIYTKKPVSKRVLLTHVTYLYVTNTVVMFISVDMTQMQASRFLKNIYFKNI